MNPGVAHWERVALWEQVNAKEPEFLCAKAMVLAQNVAFSPVQRVPKSVMVKITTAMDKSTMEPVVHADKNAAVVLAEPVPNPRIQCCLPHVA